MGCVSCLATVGKTLCPMDETNMYKPPVLSFWRQRIDFRFFSKKVQGHFWGVYRGRDMRCFLKMGYACCGGGNRATTLRQALRLRSVQRSGTTGGSLRDRIMRCFFENRGMRVVWVGETT